MSVVLAAVRWDASTIIAALIAAVPVTIGVAVSAHNTVKIRRVKEELSPNHGKMSVYGMLEDIAGNVDKLTRVVVVNGDRIDGLEDRVSTMGAQIDHMDEQGALIVAVLANDKDPVEIPDWLHKQPKGHRP